MNRKIIIIFIIVLVSLGVGGWFYYSTISQVNYLILGVPYNGITNLFFKEADSPAVTSVLDILGYWGDERFDLAGLKKRFPPSFYTPEGFVSSPSFPAIKNFFEENGYETYQWSFFKPGKEIKEIKKFVNPEKKIPAIVFQKNSLDSENFSIKSRVVIGIFDGKKKVIVHDNLLGNNYEISYQDFEKMFTNTKDTPAILAVWPSDKIKDVINGPNYNMSYPKRLEAMDKLIPLLVKLTDAATYVKKENFERANILYENIVNDPNFNYFPFAVQVRLLSVFAQSYVYFNKFDEAINIIEERALPLNHDLGKVPASDWVIPPINESSYPYLILSKAYFGKGQIDTARIYYEKMKKIRNEVAEIMKEFGNEDYAGAPDIPELEKEISKKK